MKVGVWVDEYDPKQGGGASYQVTLLKALDLHQFAESINLIFLLRNRNCANDFEKETLVLDYDLHYPKLLQRFLAVVRRIAVLGPFVSQLVYSRRRRLADDVILRMLSTHAIDFIYYPYQTTCYFPSFPFITTNWDIAHKTVMPFTEILREWDRREKWYNSTIHRAHLIFAESESGKAELVELCGVPEWKIKIVPLFSSGFELIALSEDQLSGAMNLFGLDKYRYFIYPAQFWRHKNHFNLIQAFSSFNRKNKDYKLVLTGSDKGIQNEVREKVKAFGLDKSVVFTGFVDKVTLAAMMRQAAALVFPSFLGPTNIPLIDALEMKVPIACSDLVGHREILGDCALYFSPSSHEDMANCMEDIVKEPVRSELLAISEKVADSSKFRLKVAIESLESHLLTLETYL